MSQPDNTDDVKLSARAKRRAPVIELTAAEIPTPDVGSVLKESTENAVETTATLEAAKKPDVASTSQPEPQVTPVATQKPSMVMPLALAAIVGGLFGAAGGTFIPKLLGVGGADTLRIVKLEQSIAQSPKSADLETIKQTVTRLEADTAKRLADAGKRVDDRFSALDGELKGVASRPAVVGGSSSSVDLAPLTQRIITLETAAKTADPRLAALGERVEQASKRFEAGSAAPLFAAGQALALAFHRGAPFVSELSALEVLGAKPEHLQPLKMFATDGAPTPQKLAETFAPLATKLAENPGESGSVMSYLQRFVKTRPVGEVRGDTPPALVATIEAALGKGDLALALAAWGRLPEPARNYSSAWAAQASDRDKAGKALSSFQESTIASLRKPTP